MTSPPGYADVVRSNHNKTTGFLIAFGASARRIRDAEVVRVRRRLKAPEATDLVGWRPSGSWLLAVLLDARADLRPLVTWAHDLKLPSPDRVFFYHLPRADTTAALRPWFDAELPSPPVFEIHDFVSFHKVFGKHLNDRVWLDHA